MVLCNVSVLYFLPAALWGAAAWPCGSPRRADSDQLLRPRISLTRINLTRISRSR